MRTLSARHFGVVALGLLAVAVCVTSVLADKPEKPKANAVGKAPDKAAVARTRKTVKMLDDVYKTAVVLITEHYVNDADDLPAGTAAIVLFDAIKKKGWHEVRLVDASGEPIDEENTAQDDFEKGAISGLKQGQSFVEEVVTRDGKHYLRAATPIPVVMKKCTMCHPNYEKAKTGEPIGILSYTVPIE